MNIFVAIMLCFSAWGLLDKILGGKLGLMEEFDEGLTTMGSLAVSTVGFYSIGITFVQNHADAIAAAVQRMPFDPSVLIGCLLAPDMGALAVAQRLASSASVAIFAGALVGGGLGQTLGYQLPVFLAAVRKEEIPELMRGFIFGLIALPTGLFAGGLLLGIPCSVILINMLPVLVLCVLLIVSFVASMIPAEWVTPYMVNKIVAGVVGVLLAVVCDRKA